MREKQRALVVTVVLLCLSVAVVLYSLNTGTLKLNPLVVVKTLFGFGDFQSETVLFDYRLPRIVVTMLAGVGLVLREAFCKVYLETRWLIQGLLD